MNLDKKNMSLFQIFDGKVEGGAEWFLPSILIHFAYPNYLYFTLQTPLTANCLPARTVSILIYRLCHVSKKLWRFVAL